MAGEGNSGSAFHFPHGGRDQLQHPANLAVRNISPAVLEDQAILTARFLQSIAKDRQFVESLPVAKSAGNSNGSRVVPDQTVGIQLKAGNDCGDVLAGQAEGDFSRGTRGVPRPWEAVLDEFLRLLEILSKSWSGGFGQR